MKGADEYYDLFDGKSQQIGRLFLQMSVHARGKCFEIFLLPDGVVINGDKISGIDNVEIYGVTGGQRGWTETYGWIHKGKWQDDFSTILDHKKTEKEKNRQQHIKEMKSQKENEMDRVSKLLSSYA